MHESRIRQVEDIIENHQRDRPYDPQRRRPLTPRDMADSLLKGWQLGIPLDQMGSSLGVVPSAVAEVHRLLEAE